MYQPRALKDLYDIIKDYQPGKALTSVIKRENIDRRTAITGTLEALAGGILIAEEGIKRLGGLVLKEAYAEQKDGAQLKPGMPNTLTYTNNNGEQVTVYNLNGDWEGMYNLSGGSNPEIVRITQEGNEFVGVKLIGNQYTGKGTETIRGRLKANNGEFETTSYRHSWSGWVGVSGKIRENGNKLYLVGDHIRIDLWRK